jgi:YHS domain-containing protein
VIRVLIWLLLAYIGYRFILSLTGSKESAPKAERDKMVAEPTYLDPVCGVYVSEEDAVVGKLEGQRHYFCSMSCLEKFREQLDHKP